MDGNQPAEQSTFTKQNFVLIIKPLPDLLHLCGLELFGNRPDFGGISFPRKGDAASMWHLLVRLVDGCRGI